MEKGMAFLLVGGVGNWGKSRTLNALTGSNYKAWIDITSAKDGKPYPFFIRHMSNTDKLVSYMEFIKETAHQNIIITFSADGPRAEAGLEGLSLKYRLRCFVLERRFSKPTDTISDAGLKLLENYAGDGIYRYTDTAADTERARAFRSYMEAETPF